MLQHSKRIRWVQGIVKGWVMEVCVGAVGFATMVQKLHLLHQGVKMFRYFTVTQMGQDFSHIEIRAY
jgi:hypothetical protein